MTLIEQILEIIRTQPGISDSELKSRLPGGPSRHQQINSRCRSLAENGVITHERRAKPFIGNYPVENQISDGDRAQTIELENKIHTAVKTPEAAKVAVPHSEMSIALRWHSAGEFSTDDAGKIVSPIVGAVPGIYRIKFTARRGLYVGESINLKRRMQNYRTPGPSQSTSIWVGKALLDAVSSGELVLLEICTDIKLKNSFGTNPANLDSKPIRLFAENAAIINEMNGSWSLLNKAT